LSQAHDCYGYLAVKSLDKYQHYKDRPLTWIKLYHSLLDDYAFCLLRDQDKWLFIGLCLLGTRMNNRIPADPAWLANRLSLTSSVEISGILKSGLVLKLRSNRSRALSNPSVLREEKSRGEERREEQIASRPEDGDAQPPPIERFDCTGTGPKTWDATEADVALWTAAYPAVNVKQQLKAMQAWLKANPTKRKTASGMPRFVTNWLSKAQNENGDRRAPNSPFRGQSTPQTVPAPEPFVNRLLTPEEKAEAKARYDKIMGRTNG
jgi:hypothetical protein